MKLRLLLGALLFLATFARAETTGLAARLAEGEAILERGDVDRAARIYAEVLSAAERAGDRRLIAKTLSQRGYLRYYRGETNAALLDLQRAYEIARTINDAPLRRDALTNIAHIYADASLAQYDRAIEYYRQLLTEYEAARDSTNVADTLFNLASTYERKDDLEGALSWYRRALAAEQKLGRLDEAAYVQRSIGITLSKLDRLNEALPILDEAAQFFAASGDRERLSQTRQSRGIALRKAGQYERAITDLEATRVWYVQQRNRRFLEKTQDELALAYAGAGQWQNAYRARTAQAALQRELALQLRADDTARLRLQFDAEKKEQENRALLRQNAATTRIRRLQTALLAVGAALLLLVALLAYRMRRIAMTDELTRLPNRRRILSLASDSLQRSRTRGEPFTLIAVDVDEFKRINDTWGHAAGDLVLQRVARACRAALRPGDRIGRTGGEEFTVMLPSTRPEDALAVAETLRERVEALDFSDLAPSLRVTISLGVAEWTADESLARIAARADAMLYRAKQSGRNRVELATV